MYSAFRAARLFPCATLVLALLVSGCATNGRLTERSGCAWARPVLVSHDDVLSDLTARQILVHNETGRRMCGWEAKPAPER